MKRDATIAVLAALGLSGLAGLWLLVNPAVIADPGDVRNRASLEPALPIPTPLPPLDVARDRAFAALLKRDPFVAPNPVTSARAGRFATAKIDPPVSLTPVRSSRAVARRFTQPQLQAGTTARAPEPPQQRAPSPAQPQPRQVVPAAPPAQTALAPPQMRLRGVFPNPANGGQALLAMPDGRIVTVGLGSVIAKWQVVRIGPASVSLSSPTGQQHTLRMLGY